VGITIFVNWCKPWVESGWSQLTEVRFMNPVKWNVVNVWGNPAGSVTVNVSMTVPPPASVPVNVTLGAGPNAKFRARSIESSENGSPFVCVRVMVAGANAARPLAPA
jgi:hypothetical protein